MEAVATASLVLSDESESEFDKSVLSLSLSADELLLLLVLWAAAIRGRPFIIWWGVRWLLDPRFTFDGLFDGGGARRLRESDNCRRRSMMSDKRKKISI